jgi:hypothetical protein
MVVAPGTASVGVAGNPRSWLVSTCEHTFQADILISLVAQRPARVTRHDAL